MSQSTNIVALAQAIGADIKSLNTSQGALSNLSTADKTSLVNALNEVRSQLGSGGVTIDDETPSTTTTYSSSRLEQAITNTITDLIDGAPEAFDTLKELADYVASDETAMSALTASVNNRVRYDSPQALTAPQQLQACENIGVGDPTTNFVTSYTTAKA